MTFDEEHHTVGDPDCGDCWQGYPQPHECETPGCLEHADFGDYSSYDSFWLETLGDLCHER